MRLWQARARRAVLAMIMLAAGVMLPRPGMAGAAGAPMPEKPKFIGKTTAAPQARRMPPLRPAQVVSKLTALTSPTLGGQAQVIWAGVPNVTPKSAEVSFTVYPPAGGKPLSATKKVKMTLGRAGDTTFRFPTPRAGTYLVTARLKLNAQGRETTQRDELRVVVPERKVANKKPGGAGAAGKVKKPEPKIRPRAGAIRARSASSPVTTIKLDGTLYAGGLTDSAPEDWYRFTLATTSTVTLYTVESGTLIDTDMYLYDHDQRADPYNDYLDWNDEGFNSGEMSVVTRDLDPGTYYVMVTDADDRGSYSIAGIIDEGDTAPAPLAVGSNGAWHYLSNIAGASWLTFKIDDPGDYTIETSNATFEPQLELYGPNSQSTFVARDHDGGSWDNAMLSRNLKRGTYYLKVTNYPGEYGFSGRGLYQISLKEGSKGKPVVLALDKAAQGKIATATDYDWYQFTVTELGEYSLHLTLGTLNNLYYTLYGIDASGEKVYLYGDYYMGDTGDNLSSSLYFTPGVYTLKVEGLDEYDAAGNHVMDTGTYSLSLKQDSAYSVTPLTIGQTRTKLSAPVDKLQWYQFTVTQPGSYTFVVPVYTAGGHIELYDTWFKDIAGSGCFNTGVITTNLEPGTYYLSFEGWSETAAPSVTYDLYSYDQAFGWLEASNHYESEATGVIAKSGDVNWYYLSGSYADSYTIKTVPDTLKDSVISLYDGYMNLITTNDDTGKEKMGKIVANLSSGPTYFIKVKGKTASDTGDYGIQCTQTYHNVYINDSTVPGIIDASGDPALFQFRVNTQESYRIETQAESLKDSVISLYGPDDPAKLITSDDDGGEAGMSQIIKTLAPGQYYVSVKGKTAADEGTFQIAVRNTYQPLNLNKLVAGDPVRYAGDTNYYSFDIPERTSYTFETLPGTLTDNVMALYGPNDETRLIAQDDNSGTGNMARIQAALDPGHYYLKVNGRTAKDTGNYQIQARYTFAPLTINDAAATGSIDDPAQLDWYIFQVSNRVSYTIETFPGTLRESAMYLFGPDNGTLRAMDENKSGGRMARLTATLTPGWYYLRVNGRRTSDQGSYTVQLRTRYMPLKRNGPRAYGSIDAPQEADWYTFTLTTTTLCSVQTFAGTLTDSFIRLWGPNDGTRLVTWNDDYWTKMSRIEQRLAPGTYFVQVMGRMRGDLGSYSLNLCGGEDPLPLDYYSWLEGSIDPPGDWDWYTLTITEAGTYAVETRRGTLSEDYLRLFGPGDRTTLVAQDHCWGSDGMAMMIMDLEPGTYYVKCQAFDKTKTGTYQIRAYRTYWW